jgi:uncharacterized protein (TIGR02646 family)
MKYIDKTGQKSLEGKAILDTWLANHQSIITQLSIQEDTKGLWKKFRAKNKVIQRYLLEEQGELCCYCGCQLTLMTHYIVTEHFKLKSLEPQNKYPNMFEYDNLLLSCHGNRYDFYEVKNGDTWFSIASKPDCTFKGNKVDELKRMNPDIDIENGEPKEGEKIIVGFKKGAEHHHCDNFRGDKPLPTAINPTKLPNCIDRFIYTVREKRNEGGIKSNDIEAEEVIKHLNLDSEVLKGHRKAVVENAISLFENISIELEESETIERKEIIEIANKYLSGIKDFYVVYRAYFKDDFPELFQD